MKVLARALCLAVVALISTAGADTSTTPSAGSAAPPAPVPKGLHFVFDASASMCGYLRPNDASSPMLDIIRHASVLKDDQKNNRVLLIRQKAIKASVADVVEAPPNLQALVNSPTSRQCGPFDGVDSKMELLFAARPGQIPARSLVFVSDMQMDESALLAFVDRFREWARAQGSDKPVSAGIVTFAAQFLGNYYAQSEQDPAKRKSGYALPQHVRPLNLLWFVASDEDAAIVKSLLNDLGALKTPRSSQVLYGLQVLPVQTETATAWLNRLPPTGSSQDIFGSPPVFAAAVGNSQRSPRDLNDCPRWTWNPPKLMLDVRGDCRDRRKMFDAVQEFEVRLPIKPVRGIALSVENPSLAAASESAISIRMVRRDPAMKVIALHLAPKPLVVNAAALKNLSLDNDACVNASSDCVKRLERRVYRYDAFVQQFAARAFTVLNEQLGAQKLELNVDFRK